MKNLSNNSYLKVLIKLLFLTLFAKLLAVVALWFLPVASEELQTSKHITVPYCRVDFHNLLSSTSRNTREESEVFSTNSTSIKNMVLHGLYGNSRFGYAIVATKSLPNKTEIISIGERYRGYKLKRIALNFVVFEKNNKEYTLALDTTKASSKTMRISSSSKIDNDEENIAVSRNEIKFYEKKPSQIWHDISIDEIKKNGKISGFKVKHIRKNSKIAALGLQRGDIILKANGVALTSYSAAFKIYKDINKLETLSLYIQRGNTKKELIYEIH
jgi:general secretion pathway protein C